MALPLTSRRRLDHNHEECGDNLRDRRQLKKMSVGVVRVNTLNCSFCEGAPAIILQRAYNDIPQRVARNGGG